MNSTTVQSLQSRLKLTVQSSDASIIAQYSVTSPNYSDNLSKNSSVTWQTQTKPESAQNSSLRILTFRL